MYKCGYKQTEKSQNLGICSYVPYFLPPNLLFTKSQCLRNFLYRIVIARIHFTSQLHLGSRAQILVSQQQKEKAQWQTRVLQIRAVSPKNLLLNPPIRQLQNYKRRFQMLLIYLITNLTRLSMLGTRLLVNIVKDFVSGRFANLHFYIFQGGWNNCKITEVLSY